MAFDVSFKEFSKDPLKAVTYLALGAIMYLYIDGKIVHTNQIEYLMEQSIDKDKKIEKLQSKVEELYIKISEIHYDH